MTGFPTTYDIHVIQASLVRILSRILTNITCTCSPDTSLVKGDDLLLYSGTPCKGNASKAHHKNWTDLFYVL